LILGKKAYWENVEQNQENNWLQNEWKSYLANVNLPNSPHYKTANSFLLLYNKNLNEGGIEKTDFLPADLNSVQNIPFESKDKSNENSIYTVAKLISIFYSNIPQFSNFDKTYSI
jgi:hypothetical protein